MRLGSRALCYDPIILKLIRSWRLPARWHNTRAVLRDAWPALIALAGAVVAGILALLWPAADARTTVALAGVLLQWFGLGTVAWGLVKLRRRFRRPSWFKRLWNAFQRPRDLTVQISEGVAVATGLGTAVAVGSTAPTTLEDRLQAAEQDLVQLRRDVAARGATVDSALAEIRRELRHETEERGVDIRDLLKQLEDISAGGIQLEGIGLCWLFVGVVLTSVPDQIGAFVPSSVFGIRERMFADITAFVSSLSGPR